MRSTTIALGIVGWVFAVICAVEEATAGVTVVRNDEVRAVVVTAVDPSPVAAYAAQELVDHVEKATGQRLPIAVETDIPDGYVSRIFVGETEAARKQGIDADALGYEEHVLRTIGDDLYILGKELRADEYTGSRPHGEPWNPLSPECLHSGTLFGVYEVLDRYVGVRWLWPGELGTYVPRSDTIEIPTLDETISPKLLYRDVGGWSLQQIGLTGSKYGARTRVNFSWSRLSEQLVRKLVFPTEDAGYAYGRAMDVFHRRHRRVTPIEPELVPRTTHMVANINDWWAEYGKEHPEWFAMRADGQRGRKVPRKGPYTAMCVSNAQLQRFIVQKAWDGGDILQMGEVDTSGDGFCQCPTCFAWDGPQPTDFPEVVRSYYTPRVVSDRYARFWKIVYNLAAKRNPNVKMPVYLYHNTLPGPLTGIKLNKHIYGEFVIYGSWSGWYPMSEDEDAWTRQQWARWADTGISMVYGPNYLLTLYTTPNVTTWQTGEFFKFAYEHGMVGASFRSYTFSWAAHGPMAYMHHRMLWDPSIGVEKIREEYFSAFGPAAALVEEYFDYWEDYARNRPPISSVESGDEFGALEKLRRPRGHYLAYPPKVYPPAEAILQRALEAARQDPLPEFAQRVEFLQAGMQHARLTTRLHEFLDYDGPSALIGRAPVDHPKKLEKAREVMRQIMSFRRDLDHRFVADYMSNAIVEKHFIPNIEVLVEGQSASDEYVPIDDIF